MNDSANINTQKQTQIYYRQNKNKNTNKTKITGVLVQFGFLRNFKIGLRKDNNSATRSGRRK